MRSIRDLIDEKIRDYMWENDEEALLIKMDTYSLAMLREELGVPSDRDLNVYHGLKIVVDADTDNEIVRVIGIEQLT